MIPDNFPSYNYFGAQNIPTFTINSQQSAQPSLFNGYQPQIRQNNNAFLPELNALSVQQPLNTQFGMQNILLLVMSMLQSLLTQQSVGVAGQQNPFGIGAIQKPGSVYKSNQLGQASSSASKKTSNQDSRVLLGSWINPASVNAKGQVQSLDTFNARLGQSLDIQNLFFNENRNMKLDVKAMQDNAKNGVTSMVSYRSKDYADVLAGKSDATLKELANTFKSVDGPVYLRLNWEMNGNKNTGYGSAEDYKKSWQYIHNFLEKEGVDNVQFVWTPTSEGFQASNGKAPAFYPGDDYVDFIGADGYSGIHAGKYRSPGKIFDESVDFARAHGKQFVIGETGVAAHLGADAQVQYIHELQQWVKDNPEVKAVVWFNNADNGPGHDNFSLFSSDQQWNAFKEMANDPYFN